MAHSSHRRTVPGRIASKVALTEAALSRAHPAKALAGYQTARLDRVTAVRKPYIPLGGTTPRINGTLMMATSTHEANSRAAFVAYPVLLAATVGSGLGGMQAGRE